MEKLVGNQRKILKLIYKKTKHSKNFNDYPKIDIDVVLDKLSNNIVIYDDLQHLEHLGYIQTSSTCVALTAQGRSYFKLRHFFWIELCIKSVFCPILVAFITTLITLWLKGLL